MHIFIELFDEYYAILTNWELYMLSDNVLISSLIFFMSCGLLWIINTRIHSSNLSPRIKRVISYLGFALIFVIIVSIFNHHSENYLAINS